jgi:hypothetical protein
VHREIAVQRETAVVVGLRDDVSVETAVSVVVQEAALVVEVGVAILYLKPSMSTATE